MADNRIRERNIHLLAKILLFSSLAVALVQPAAAQTAPLLAPDEWVYEGQFSDGQLHLELRAQPPYYVGSLQFRGQQYPLQAQQQNHALHGFFQDNQGHRFTFSAQRQAEVLAFVTDGEHFQLRSQVSVPAMNPLSQASTSSAPPIAPMTAKIPQFVPQTPQAILSQFHSLNTQIGHDFQLFLIRLRQWLSGNLESTAGENAAHASQALLSQQLLPLALELQRKLAHLGVLSSQIGSIMQLTPQETKLMRQFIILSNKGSRFFEQWYLLLKLMLELYDSGDQQGLYDIAQQQLPVAVKNAIAFVRNFVVLLRAADNLQYRPLDAPSAQQNDTQVTLNPKQMFKWETLRNMSQMMRDAMRIMGATGH